MPNNKKDKKEDKKSSKSVPSSPREEDKKEEESAGAEPEKTASSDKSPARQSYAAIVGTSALSAAAQAFTPAKDSDTPKTKKRKAGAMGEAKCSEVRKMVINHKTLNINNVPFQDEAVASLMEDKKKLQEELDNMKEKVTIPKIHIKHYNSKSPAQMKEQEELMKVAKEENKVLAESRDSWRSRAMDAETMMEDQAREVEDWTRIGEAAKTSVETSTSKVVAVTKENEGLAKEIVSLREQLAKLKAEVEAAGEGDRAAKAAREAREARRREVERAIRFGNTSNLIKLYINNNLKPSCSEASQPRACGAGAGGEQAAAAGDQGGAQAGGGAIAPTKCGAAISCGAQAAAGVAHCGAPAAQAAANNAQAAHVAAQIAPVAHAAAQVAPVAPAPGQDQGPVDLAGLRNCWYEASSCPDGAECGRIHLTYGKSDSENLAQISNTNSIYSRVSARSRGTRPRDSSGQGTREGEGQGPGEANGLQLRQGSQGRPWPRTPRRRSREPWRLQERDVVTGPAVGPAVVPDVPAVVPNVPAVVHNVPHVPDPTINRNIYLDLLKCRRVQYANRYRLRKICIDQIREARTSRDMKLSKIKEAINHSDKISKWCTMSLTRNKLKQFFGVEKVRRNQLAGNLFQSLQKRTEILEENLKLTALKSKLNKERFQKYKKHCTSKHNNKNIRAKVKKESLKIYSVNARSVNNKRGSIKNIIESGDADIYFFSETNTNKSMNFQGHHNFNFFDKRRFHGLTAVCGNHLKGKLLRIPHDDTIELVHLLHKETEPATNIIGVYLDVEARTTTAKTLETWTKLKVIANDILERGEALILVGDMNRPVDREKQSYGTKLLNSLLEEATLELINDLKTPTRIDPATNMGSVLDLCLISKNISKATKPLKVDTERLITPFSISKIKGVPTPKYTDHLAITVEIEVHSKIKRKKEKTAIINFANKEGWIRYKEKSNEYAKQIIEVVRKHDDPEKLDKEINIIDTELQIASFGITWKGETKKKKKKDSKEIKEIYMEQQNELEETLKAGLQGKDLNRRMYKLRDIVEGPKVKPQEPMAINNPKTGELITDEKEIKQVSLEHNIKILTKNAPRKQDEEKFEKMRVAHELTMNKNDLDAWTLEKTMFDKVCKKIKLKNKNLYNLFNRAGEDYKEAIFEYMAKLIKTESIPKSFLNTSLTQIWKKKGSALDLNNMRFIHMRHWHSKLIEALVTEKMKADIVEATPQIQLGGMPGASCVDHLVVLKTWMKYKEENKLGGILCTFDMSKFFDKEPLRDIMNVLRERAKIDNKCYRLWYRLNENTRISVRTSVGESKCAVCPDTIGQGLEGSALVSSCSIGTAIQETFKNEFSTWIGNLGLCCLIFQDDIGKLNDTLKEVREGCNKIDETLKSKLLSLNYDKSKFVIIGSAKARAEMENILKKDPIKMGNVIIEQAMMEKYLGDLIHQLGCARSIQETIKDRIRKLKTTCDEIIKTSESPWMGSLRNSETPFKLFEARVIPSLLNNSESWIDIQNGHIKDLQDFQDEFIRRVLHLPAQTTKAIINWDIGMMPMKWRIAGKKLQYMRKIQLKEDDNITKRALQQEVETGTNGLAHECMVLANELGLQNVMHGNTSKQLIKRTIAKKIKEEAWNAMEDSKKVRDRLTFNPEDNNYIKCLSLPLTRVWFRYRARAIPKVKGNHKQSHSDMSCNLCTSKEEMSQEHLEICEGTEHERRGLDMGTWRGLLDFWRRMMKKLGATAT